MLAKELVDAGWCAAAVGREEGYLKFLWICCKYFTGEDDLKMQNRRRSGGRCRSPLDEVLEGCEVAVAGVARAPMSEGLDSRFW